MLSDFQGLVSDLQEITDKKNRTFKEESDKELKEEIQKW
jgi:hypothetical protein